MSTRRQREMIRLKRIEFDKQVEENRRDKPVKTEAKKRGRPKKKVE